MTNIIFLLLLNIIFCVNIDEYYRNLFTIETRDPHLKLTNKSNDSIIPFIISEEDIPINATLLRINKTLLIISCTKYPYDDLLYQYANQYFTKKKINSSFLIELINLIFKILYFKYAPIESIKKEFKPMNLSIIDEYQYELNNILKEYIDVIYSQLNSPKYYFDFSKYSNNYFIEKYKLGDIFIVNEIYEYIIKEIKLNKNEKVSNFLKSFLFDKKEEFIKLYFYININGFSLPYPQFEHFYLGKQNSTDYIKANYMCVYLSPITDMMATKVNIRNRGFNFISYPVFNNSLLIYTKSHIPMKETNGILTKYFTISNENVFFLYNNIYNEYKKFDLQKYIYLKLIDVIVPKKYIEGPENKKITICQLLNTCKGIVPVSNDNNLLKIPYIISTDSENPTLISLGRTLFLDEEYIDEEDKGKIQFLVQSLTRGIKINEENELLTSLFYYDQLKRDFANFKDYFSDIKNKEKEIKSNKDLFKLIELNLNVVLKNFIFILNKLEVQLNHEIIDNI